MKNLLRVILDPSAFLIGVFFPFMIFAVVAQIGVPSLVLSCLFAVLLASIIFTLPCGFFLAGITDSAICNFFIGISSIFSSKLKARKYGWWRNILLTIILRYRSENKRFQIHLKDEYQLLHLFHCWGVCLIKGNEVISFGNFTIPFKSGRNKLVWEFDEKNDKIIILSSTLGSIGDWARREYYMLSIGEQITCQRLDGQLSYNNNYPKIKVNGENFFALISQGDQGSRLSRMEKYKINFETLQFESIG